MNALVIITIFRMALMLLMLCLLSASSSSGTCSAFMLMSSCHQRRKNSESVGAASHYLLLQLDMARKRNTDKNNDNEEDDNDDESSFDADAARQKLESLLLKGQQSQQQQQQQDDEAAEATSDSAVCTVQDLLRAVVDYNNNNHNDDNESINKLPVPPPPLTATDRDRRLVEIQLLQQLLDPDYDDATSSLLWNLWYNERGPTAQRILVQCDQLLGSNSSGDVMAAWNECERLLTSMIAQYGPYFTEPINRLATLYYLQGRYQESYQLCRVVLHTKPWHFGALSGIVLVLQQLGDHEKARYWAERRLPSAVVTDGGGSGAPKKKSSQRSEWVTRALANAQESLQQAEKRTQEFFLGKPESYYDKKKQKETLTNIDDNEDGGDAWQ